MKLISPHFNYLDEIPEAYTKYKLNTNPGFQWIDYPQNVGGFLLVLLNTKTMKIHWGVLFDEYTNKISQSTKTNTELINDFGTRDYVGPDEINDGIITYTFIIYALKNAKVIPSKLTTDDNIMAQASLKVLYNSYLI